MQINKKIEKTPRYLPFASPFRPVFVFPFDEFGPPGNLINNNENDTGTMCLSNVPR